MKRKPRKRHSVQDDRYAQRNLNPDPLLADEPDVLNDNVKALMLAELFYQNRQ